MATPWSEEVVDVPVRVLEQLDDPGGALCGVESHLEVFFVLRPPTVLRWGLPRPRPRQQLLAVEPPQVQQHEWVGVEQPAHLHGDGEGSPPYGSSSTPASSACSTGWCGRSPASSAATRPDSTASTSTKASAAGVSSTGTATRAVQVSSPSATAATTAPESTVSPPTSPVRARARPARRSSSAYDDSSTARIQALPHHEPTRAWRRAPKRGWETLT